MTEEKKEPERRRTLKRLVWAAPAVVGVASVKARVQAESCAPPPPDPGEGCAPP
jgi:hypothetical protein